MMGSSNKKNGRNMFPSVERKDVKTYLNVNGFVIDKKMRVTFCAKCVKIECNCSRARYLSTSGENWYRMNKKYSGFMGRYRMVLYVRKMDAKITTKWREEMNN